MPMASTSSEMRIAVVRGSENCVRPEGKSTAALWLASGVLVMFDLFVPWTSDQILPAAPIALPEMVMAVYLIDKGFKPVPESR